MAEFYNVENFSEVVTTEDIKMIRFTPIRKRVKAWMRLRRSVRRRCKRSFGMKKRGAFMPVAMILRQVECRTTVTFFQ